jgi:hypothetical protein
MEFKANPRKPKTQEDFVGGGSVQTVPDYASTETLPWINMTKTKRTERFIVLLTEAEAAKLAYIANNTKYSRQSFIQEVLLPSIDKKISEILKK